jgi:hypothetical protein
MRHSSLAARIDKRIEDLYGLFISTSCENNRVANAYSGHPVDERGRGAPDEATCAKIDAWRCVAAVGSSPGWACTDPRVPRCQQRPGGRCGV